MRSIAAALFAFNTFGQGLVSSGFPLRPGDVTEGHITRDEVCLFVNGQEQATYLEALRGRFADTSLRSLLVQLQHDIPSAAAIPAELRIGSRCRRSHVSKTPVDATAYLAARVVLPTDPVHLTQTWVTFQPLLPASDEDAVSRAYFTTLLDQRFEGNFPYASSTTRAKDAELTSGNYQATYESARGLFAAWQKTGSAKYFYNAYQRAWYLLTGYSLPRRGQGQITPEPNPNGLPGVGSTGAAAEWHSQRYLSFGSAYLLTGLDEYWSVVSISMSTMLGTKTTAAQAADPSFGWVDDVYIGRFNLIHTWTAGLSVLIDATRPFSGPYGGVTAFTNFDARLKWLLDAWERYEYNEGTHRDGLVGNRQTSTNGGTLPAGDLPHFQLALMTDFLIYYYTNVYADPRIPRWVQRHADIVIGDTVPLLSSEACYAQGARWGYAYMLTRTPGRTGTADPWSLPMWSGTFAFLYAHTRDAKYLTWYQRSVDPANVSQACLGWSWKIFGEMFGNAMAAPYYVNRGLPPLPQTIRQPASHNAPPVTSR